MGAGRISLAVCVTTVLAIAWSAAFVLLDPLHKASVGKPFNFEPVFYWDRMRSGNEAYDFSELKGREPIYQPAPAKPTEETEEPKESPNANADTRKPAFPPNAAGQCDSGGAGFLSMAVLAFVCINFALLCLILRFVGKPIGSPQLPPELLFALLAAFFLVLACIVWGATCFAITRNNPNTAVKMTGFGYVIAATALLCLTLPFLTWLMRKYQAKYGEPTPALSFAIGAPGGPSTDFTSSMWNKVASWGRGERESGGAPGSGSGMLGAPRGGAGERERGYQQRSYTTQPSFQERAASWLPGWKSESQREERRAREAREKWMWQQQVQPQQAQQAFPPRPYPGGSVQYSSHAAQPQFMQQPPQMYQQQLPLSQAISVSGQQELQAQRERMQPSGRQIPIQQALAEHSQQPPQQQESSSQRGWLSSSPREPPQQTSQQQSESSTAVPIDIRYQR